MKLSELRPGMENLTLDVELTSVEEPRDVETYTGTKHTLVEGTVKDVSGSVGLTVWNEKISELGGVKPGERLRLVDVFVTSYKRKLSVNVGRDSSVEKR
jgi:ssDNA-binding replication factor A large subunit